MSGIVMNIPVDVRYKLQSLVDRHSSLQNEVDEQNEYIVTIQKGRSTRQKKKDIQEAIHYRNVKFLEMCKAIRAVFLYLNRNKKFAFGFNNKSSSFWNTCVKRKKLLILQCKNIIDKNKYNEEIRKYVALTIKTLEKYDENYGLKIGLVLNRLFCRDISWTIYQYI